MSVGGGGAHAVRDRGAIVEPSQLLLAAVIHVVSGLRCDLTTEAATQANLEAAFVAAFGAEAVSREHRLGPADRPDFLIGGAIVVEAKGKRHRGPAVLRQLQRYAAYPEVRGIVLATARAMELPRSLAGVGGAPVPLALVNLGRAWL